MAKVDHLKQLQGRSWYSPNERMNKSRNYNSGSFHRTIRLSIPQQKTLLAYIYDETVLFNQLINHFQSRAKSTPDFFAQLTDEHKELFYKLLGENFDIRKLRNKKSSDIELPEELKPYHNILFGAHGDDEDGLSDKFSIFYEGAFFKGLILKDTKLNMAQELMEFFSNQAKELTKSKSFFESTDQSSRSSIETIEQVNHMQKRHVQISKAYARIEWDENKEYTKIYIPLLRNPIIVEADLRESPSWTTMIIHQDPGTLPLGKEVAWEIDFRHTNYKYLIKYLETKNPMTQMKSRYVGNRGLL